MKRFIGLGLVLGLVAWGYYHKAPGPSSVGWAPQVAWVAPQAAASDPPPLAVLAPAPPRWGMGNGQGSWSTPSSDLSDPACAGQLPNGRAAYFVPASSLRGAVVLCYPSFVVLYSPLVRTGLWSAEYLDADRVASAREQVRNDVFHVDPALPASASAQLSDFVHSGFDRGHMSPSADQPSAETQADSFSLANMAPQNPGLNRGPWERLESAVRRQAMSSPLYVVTGVRFVGQDIGFLKGRVGVPTTYYKLVYSPSRREATVFEAANEEGGSPTPYSVAEFERLSGISFGLGEVGSLALSIPSRRQ